MSKYQAIADTMLAEAVEEYFRSPVTSRHYLFYQQARADIPGKLRFSASHPDPTLGRQAWEIATPEAAPYMADRNRVMARFRPVVYRLPILPLNDPS